MQECVKKLEMVNSVTGIPLALLGGNGLILESWPRSEEGLVLTEAITGLIRNFVLMKRDFQHPVIYFFEPGFLLGIMEPDTDLFLVIGLVSPYTQTRSDILQRISKAIHPAYLQSFCDRLLKQPLVSLDKMKALICLISSLFGTDVVKENILFVDHVSSQSFGKNQLGQSLFEQREEAAFHVPTDHETAICSAIESGNQILLERSLFSPYQGHVGQMSANELRQEKYSFICMATLASRAAIRGGLDEEIAFSLSDLYCQRADLLTNIPHLQRLTVTMLTDFCSKVQEIQKRSNVSPVIRKCLSYISVHLHESITLADLSRHCSLCARSLSLNFRKEMGVGIPEYIHREKLQEAEYLLRHSDYTLSEITSFLNYPSQSYFTQIFKKMTGLTPQRYRDLPES